MQVIGLCRFSYPALGGFQTVHDSVAAREAYLFHPDRIEERFATFEWLTLPSIRAQTDPDFTFLVVTGTGMPAALKARLHEMTRDTRQLRIMALPPQRHRPAMQSAINSVRDMSAPCAQFRLDDDDAVAVDFVAKLRARALEASDVIREYGSVAVDFNHGHLLKLDAAQLSTAPVARSLLTAALGVAVGADEPRSVMNFGHHKLPDYMPTWSFPDPDMFIRGIGGFNDSSDKALLRDTEFAPLTQASRALFHTRFATDSRMLAARLRLNKIRQK